MGLYLLEPEVAGEFGEKTIISNFEAVREKGQRPIVVHLHYLLTGWLGDELLECTPCFIVTKELATDIEKSDLNGYTFENVDVSTSDEFNEMYPDRSIPQFVRLIPKGTVEVVDDDNYKNWSGNDICLTRKSYLVVSEAMFIILKRHHIDNCDVTFLKEV